MTQRRSRLEHVRTTTSQDELDKLRKNLSITDRTVTPEHRAQVTKMNDELEWLLRRIEHDRYAVLRALGFEVCAKCGKPVGCGGSGCG